MNPLMMMQLVQQLKNNPMSMLSRAGLNVPQGANNPQAIIQHLLNSGQITQEQYNQAQMLAQNFK